MKKKKKLEHNHAGLTLHLISLKSQNNTIVLYNVFYMAKLYTLPTSYICITTRKSVNELGMNH